MFLKGKRQEITKPWGPRGEKNIIKNIIKKKKKMGPHGGKNLNEVIPTFIKNSSPTLLLTKLETIHNMVLGG